MQRQISEFLASSVARRAFSGLADSARIQIRSNDGDYVFFRRGADLKLEKQADGDTSETDLEFRIPNGAMEKLLRKAQEPGASVGALGILAINLIFSNDINDKVSFRVPASLFTLVRKGYFSVLIAGGPEIFLHLRKFGFGDLAKIKNVLHKNRRTKE